MRGLRFVRVLMAWKNSSASEGKAGTFAVVIFVSQRGIFPGGENYFCFAFFKKCIYFVIWMALIRVYNRA